MNESVVYTRGRGIQAPMGGFSLHPTHREKLAMDGAPGVGAGEVSYPTIASLLEAIMGHPGYLVADWQLGTSSPLTSTSGVTERPGRRT